MPRSKVPSRTTPVWRHFVILRGLGIRPIHILRRGRGALLGLILQESNKASRVEDKSHVWIDSEGCAKGRDNMR